MSFLDTIFGAALSGIVIASLIFGILTLQSWQYFSNYSKDPIYFKLLVLVIWTLEGFQLGTTTHMIYMYLIKDFGQTTPLLRATWDWALYLGLSAIAAALVQSFLIRRLFLLMKEWKHQYLRYAIAGVISIIALVQLGFGLAVMEAAFSLHYFMNFTSFTWGLDIWLACACSADILIAATMCYCLHSSRTGISKTDRLINKLMAYSIQTGAVTSIAEIISLATFTTLGFNFAHVFISFPLGGLYATSLLANLNARQVKPGRSGLKNVIESTNLVNLGSTTDVAQHVRQHTLNSMQFAAASGGSTTYQDDATKTSSFGLNDTLPESGGYAGAELNV